MLLGPCLISNLAQLVSPSVALQAELVLLTFLAATSSLALLTISCSSLADIPAVCGLLVAALLEKNLCPLPLPLILDVVLFNVLHLKVVIIMAFIRYFDQIIDMSCTLESCTGVLQCLGRYCLDSHKTLQSPGLAIQISVWGDRLMIHNNLEY